MKWKWLRLAAPLTLGIVIASCGGSSTSAPDFDTEVDMTPVPTPEPQETATVRADSTPFVLDLPEGFPEPRIPEDNALTIAKVDLGRLLFYDNRMSVNLNGSCASCHEQRRAFTDGLVTSVGPTGEVHSRNAMSLTNVIYNPRQNWANPTLRDLTEQALAVMFSEEIIELGWANREQEILDRFRVDADYPELFVQAFGNEQDPFTALNVAKAVASFVAVLLSGDSAEDKARSASSPEPLSSQAQAGRDLFFSERLECFHCHSTFNFTNTITHASSRIETVAFFNNGLYNIAGPGPGLPLENGNYPSGNHGLYDFTGNQFDMGKFRTPTLRNIALTSPYMHDGSIATLREVLVDHYSFGGRTIADGPNAGNGAESRFKDTLLRGFRISEAEIQQVLAFLNSLTDWSFICNPEFSDPFGNIPMHERCPVAN